MYVARLLCSDPACAETIVEEARTLRELEVLACDCGCAFAVIGWPDRVDDAGAADVLVLRPRGDGLPEAA